MHHLQGMLICRWARESQCVKPQESLECGVSILAGTGALPACLMMLTYVFSSSSPQISFLVLTFFLLPTVPFALRNSLFLLASSGL